MADFTKLEQLRNEKKRQNATVKQNYTKYQSLFVTEFFEIT